MARCDYCRGRYSFTILLQSSVVLCAACYEQQQNELLADEVPEDQAVDWMSGSDGSTDEEMEAEGPHVDDEEGEVQEPEPEPDPEEPQAKRQRNS